MAPFAAFRVAAAALIIVAPAARAQVAGTTHDLVIAGGRVIDPESGLDGVRWIGVQGGRITSISAQPLEGRTVLDARGHVVAPGFIDLHAHGQDAANYRLFALDGVTTALEMEVGTEDVVRWYAEREGKALINYGVTVGHPRVRMQLYRDPGDLLPAGPAAHTRATADQIAQLRAAIGRGLAQGALGVGFGLQYTPGASRFEVLEMFREAAAARAPAFVHVRAYGTEEPGGSVESFMEVIAAAAITGAPLHIVHLNSMSLSETPKTLRIVEEARARGMDLTTEAYPYSAGLTEIRSALLDQYENAPDSVLAKLQWPITGERLNRESFQRFRQQGGVVVLHLNTPEMEALAISSPLTAIASDGGLRNGVGHPRTAGTYARVLAHYVRERQALTLPEAIRKMSLLPAQRLEQRAPMFRDKGRIRIGADADIAVFDPNTVADRATYADPGLPSIGFRHVLVNGTPVVRDGQIVDGVLPGRAARAPHANTGTQDPGIRVDSVFAEFGPGTPGCAVGVMRGGALVFARGYGMSNLEHGVPITARSIFHVASISKQFTAMAIALLARDGRLSLDDDIRRHLPEVPDFGTVITIRHLLHHTSGLRDQWELLSYAGWRADDPKSQQDILGLVARQRELNFPPGDQYLYSNTGYTLLAEIAARVSGMSFRAFTEERIFKPLRMTSTHFHDDHSMIVKGRTDAYVSGAQGGYRISIPVFDNAGATSLFTTVEDLASWDRNFDRPVVGDAAVFEMMHAHGRLNDGQQIPYALALVHGDWRGLRTVGHGGADAGYRADYLRFPDEQLSVATLCNTPANPGLLNRRVAEVFLGSRLAPAPAAGPSPVSRGAGDAQTLRDYPGVFWSGRHGSLLEVAADSGRLYASLGGTRRPLSAIGSGRFEVAGEEVALVFSPEQGRPDRVTLEQPSGAMVFDRMAPVGGGDVTPFAGSYYSDELAVSWELAAQDGRLVLRRPRIPDRALDATFADAFRLGGTLLHFSRDANGQIDGFRLTGGRVRHLRFVRTDAPAAGRGTSR